MNNWGFVIYLTMWLSAFFCLGLGVINVLSKIANELSMYGN